MTKSSKVGVQLREMTADDIIHKTHTTNPLAFFAQYPSGVCFDSQEKGERIILLLRQHIVSQFGAIVEVLFIIALPFLVVPFFGMVNVNLGDFLEARQIFWLATTWYFFAFGFTFYKFIHWYFNVYILTNERIVDFDYRGVLHLETAYANLDQIQDVSPKIIGFFGTLFHFGNVYLQTAGERQEFEFHHVGRPDEAAKRILEEVRLESGERPGEVK